MLDFFSLQQFHRKKLFWFTKEQWKISFYVCRNMKTNCHYSSQFEIIVHSPPLTLKRRTFIMLVRSIWILHNPSSVSHACTQWADINSTGITLIQSIFLCLFIMYCSLQCPSVHINECLVFQITMTCSFVVLMLFLMVQSLNRRLERHS